MNFLNEALALKEILHVWGPVFCYRQGPSVIQRTLEEKMRSLLRTQWGHKRGVQQTGTAGGGHQGHILRSFAELSREFSRACWWCSAPGGLGKMDRLLTVHLDPHSTALPSGQRNERTAQTCSTPLVALHGG